MAYEQLYKEHNTDENKISNLKNAFITNLYLYRIGEKLQLRRYMIANDPEPKDWVPSFVD